MCVFWIRTLCDQEWMATMSGAMRVHPFARRLQQTRTFSLGGQVQHTNKREKHPRKQFERQSKMKPRNRKQGFERWHHRGSSTVKAIGESWPTLSTTEARLNHVRIDDQIDRGKMRSAHSTCNPQCKAGCEVTSRHARPGREHIEQVAAGTSSFGFYPREGDYPVVR